MILFEEAMIYLRKAYYACKPTRKPKKPKIDMNQFVMKNNTWTAIDAVFEDVVNNSINSDVMPIASATVRNGLSRGYIRSTTCPVNVPVGTPLITAELRETFDE